MDQLVYWIATTVLGLMIGALGWFIKRLIDGQKKEMEALRAEVQSSMRQTNGRIDKLEDKLQETIESMPYKYTMREDFIRSVSGLEQKLDKILEKLSAR